MDKDLVDQLIDVAQRVVAAGQSPPTDTGT